MNVERFDLGRDGAIGFSHPNGTHDDISGPLLLAVYGTCEMSSELFLAVVPRIARRARIRLPDVRRNLAGYRVAEIK